MDVLGPHRLTAVSASDDDSQVRLTLADGGPVAVPTPKPGCAGAPGNAPLQVYLPAKTWQRSGMNPGDMVRVSICVVGRGRHGPSGCGDKESDAWRDME